MATQSKAVLTGLAAVLIIVLLFFPAAPNTQAQTGITFTPADQFSIPALNGTISFSVNGSCSAATLENGTWIFNDLRLNHSQPLGTLKISAENSNVTVYSYRTNLFGRSAMLNYTVEGQGTQKVNLGLNSSQPTNPGEWYVVVAGNVVLAEGHGWNLLPDNTVVVRGVTGNVYIVHYSYNIPISTGPFYEQHSIALITAALVAIIIVVAVVIRVKVRM